MELELLEVPTVQAASGGKLFQESMKRYGKFKEMSRKPGVSRFLVGVSMFFRYQNPGCSSVYDFGGVCYEKNVRHKRSSEGIF